MKAAYLLAIVLVLSSVAAAEDIFRDSFEGPPRKSLLANTWGDVPAAVAVNSTEPGVGRGGSAAARLSLTFPAKVTEHTRLREAHRCVDNGYFLVRAAGPCSQTDHRTYIMDPWGMTLGGSQFHADNEPVIVTLQLDNRPQYYEWPEAVRKSGPYPDPYQRGLQPEAKGDLRAVLLKQRRPELYRPRPEPKKNWP